MTLDNISAPTLVQVRIKASKTDPFRKGVEPDPFFKFATSTPLSRTALVSRMRTALESSGVDASKYSGHSFRSSNCVVLVGGCGLV